MLILFCTSFIGHLLCFFWLFFFHSISVLNMFLCMKNILKVKKVKVSPTVDPFLHRKHCSWNASSVGPALILSLGDITLRYHVTHLHILCLAVSFAQNNWYNAAALLLVVLAQTIMSWPIRAYCVLRRGALNRRELKQSVSDRGGIQSCSTKQHEKTDVFFEH